MEKPGKKPGSGKERKKTDEDSSEDKPREPKWDHSSSKSEVDALKAMRSNKNKKDKPDEPDAD